MRDQSPTGSSNKYSRVGGGLGGGPMRGIHPHPFHPFKSPQLNLGSQLQSRNEELSSMILPKIEKRKLSDLMTDNTKNPFALESTTERLLVMREKRRELEKLDSIKAKIEHKYLSGNNLMQSLSHGHQRSLEDTSMSTNRQGMINQVESIEPLKIPAEIHHTFNSAA